MAKEACLKASRVQSEAVIVIAARNPPRRIRRVATASDFARAALRHRAFYRTRVVPMIVTPECASAHIRGRYKSKRPLRSRIRRRRRSGMTNCKDCVATDPYFMHSTLGVRRAPSKMAGPDWRSMPQSIPRSIGCGRHRDGRPERASAHAAPRNRFRFCACRARKSIVLCMMRSNRVAWPGWNS